MGNDRTLKLIASAAQKLPRVDPEYAERVTRNRTRRHRARLRVAASEYEAIYAKFVVENNEPEIDADPTSPGLLVDNLLENHHVYNRTTRRGRPVSEMTPKQPKSNAEPKKVKAKPAAKPTGRVPMHLEHDGLSLTLVEWSKRTGMPRGTIYSRIRDGFTVDEALTFSMKRAVRANRPKKEKQPKIKVAVSKVHLYEFEGERLILTDWAERYRICRNTLCTRLRRGWPIEIALKTKAGAILGANSWRRRGWIPTSTDTLETGQLPPRDSLPK